MMLEDGWVGSPTTIRHEKGEASLETFRVVIAERGFTMHASWIAIFLAVCSTKPVTAHEESAGRDAR